jgi:spatacsin
MIINGEKITVEQERLISGFGNLSNMQSLLDSIALQNGWRFTLIALHYKASNILAIPHVFNRKTSELIESKLSVIPEHWPLVRELLITAKMSVSEVAHSLSQSFFKHVSSDDSDPNCLSKTEFSEKFMEFAKMCESPHAVGDCLFEIALRKDIVIPNSVKVNLLLHSAVTSSDIDECAEVLDGLLDNLTQNGEIDLIIQIVSVFPDPSLLPRFFQYLIAQQKLDFLSQGDLSDRVGRTVINCARRIQPFQPEKYFAMTLQYHLYRDHAELQLECAHRLLLTSVSDKSVLQEASRHYLLALAYFLHEKCYCLSMECLKKLSLISLQLEIAEPSVFNLEKGDVLRLMCEREFPFALTVAVAYDMDNDVNWAEAVYQQSILHKGDDFLTSIQYFRPVTSNLCEGVVKCYRGGSQADEVKDRMKTFLLAIPNLVERYRIVKDLEFEGLVESMKENNPVVCEWCDRVLMNKS